MNSHDLPKIGLALGSGASRGWSHIGVIKALLKAGIEPDVICGTSVGAIIGGSYVAGNLDKIEEWVLSSTRSDVLRFFKIGLTQSGFVDTGRMSWFLYNYVASEERLIEHMPKKFGAVSTNLDNGREVWFTEGGLADAVRASMALPGLFPPVSNERRWLVDGGLVNPVPVSICRALGAEVVIAVNLNFDILGKRSIVRRAENPVKNTGMLGKVKQQAKEYSNAILPNREGKEEIPSFFYTIANSVNIFQDRITRSRLAGDPAELMLTPRLSHIGMLDFHRAAEAIKEGEECVQKALPEIRRLAGRQ